MSSRREERAFDFALHFAALHLAETAGVPEFVAEIAAQLHVLFVEQHVLAERRAAHGAEAEGVRAVLAMSTSGSGELPSVLDILRPCLSRMMPVK